jgi:NifU-like protein involved in Fe-S cluster formation
VSYSQLVRQLFATTPHAGRIPRQGDVRIGRAGGPAHGVEVEFSILVSGARVARACFRAFGCPYTIAGASLVAQRLSGARLAGFRVDPQALARELDAPAEKLGNLLIVEEALIACLGRDARGP